MTAETSVTLHRPLRPILVVGLISVVGIAMRTIWWDFFDREGLYASLAEVLLLPFSVAMASIMLNALIRNVPSIRFDDSGVVVNTLMTTRRWSWREVTLVSVEPLADDTLHVLSGPGVLAVLLRVRSYAPVGFQCSVSPVQVGLIADLCAGHGVQFDQPSNRTRRESGDGTS